MKKPKHDRMELEDLLFGRRYLACLEIKESPSKVKQKIHETTTEQKLEETIQKSFMDTKQLPMSIDKRYFV